MRPRALQTAREVAQTRLLIQRRLDRLAVETQPEVAAAVLDLSLDRSAGLAQFARVVRGDGALAARVLRQANSAFFRQSEPVADLDRACVVLGADRLRAAALCFTLDRADPRSPERRLARRVWRDSIMRACIAASLCDAARPRLAPPAFVAGLMLDVGQPLLARLLGQPAIEVLQRNLPPHAGLAAESRTLPMTHVDVVSVLCERWGLPPILAQAIEFHHAPVRDHDAQDDAAVLRRAAHLAGLVELEPATGQPAGSPAGGELIPPMAERLLGLSGTSLAQTLDEARREFARVRTQLQGVSSPATDLHALASRVQEQVGLAVEQMLTDTLRRGEPDGPRAIRLGGRIVEIEHQTDGRWALFLVDSLGERIAIHEIRPGDGVPTVMESLALDPREGDQVDALVRLLRLVA